MVSKKVREDLTERAKSFGIVLDDISLTHLNFGREFTDAVEAKQVAQQEAERAKFVVERVDLFSIHLRVIFQTANRVFHFLFRFSVIKFRKCSLFSIFSVLFCFRFFPPFRTRSFCIRPMKNGFQCARRSLSKIWKKSSSFRIKLLAYYLNSCYDCFGCQLGNYVEDSIVFEKHYSGIKSFFQQFFGDVKFFECLLQEEQIKLARIIAAEGDSKGAELLAKSLNQAGEGLLEMRKIEAAEEIANSLAKSKNVSYLPKGQNILMNLPTM